MSLSVAVMAHPKRAGWVPSLARRLGDCQVVWDRYNDRHETGLRSILAYDPQATHHLIVQDDAVLSRNLRAGVARLVRLTGEHPVGLYMGKTGPQAAVLRAMVGTLTPRFISGEGPHWGVAIVLPTVHIPELAVWYEQQTTPNYDRRIARWYKHQKIDCWYTAPSLVDHRADNPSLVNGRRSDRHAAWFIGADVSAARVDWETEPWTLPTHRTVIFSGPKGRVVRIREGSLRYGRYMDHPDWLKIGVE